LWPSYASLLLVTAHQLQRREPRQDLRRHTAMVQLVPADVRATTSEPRIGASVVVASATHLECLSSVSPPPGRRSTPGMRDPKKYMCLPSDRHICACYYGRSCYGIQVRAGGEQAKMRCPTPCGSPRDRPVARPLRFPTVLCLPQSHPNLDLNEVSAGTRFAVAYLNEVSAKWPMLACGSP
jgi:hypothetical protein